jgi:hypothetical protein
MAQEVKNVVLVHGGFVDGSGWQGVYRILKKDGYASPGAPVPPILPPQGGYLFLDKSKFAADVPPDVAAFMADSQVPWGVEALGGAVTSPAWKAKPSWYLVTTDDRMIPPDAQRAMSKRAEEAAQGVGLLTATK